MSERAQPHLPPDADGGILVQDRWDEDPAYAIPGYKDETTVG